jgi:uncharacterized protein (DUF1330 family)
MAAYVIADIDVHDPEKFEGYRQQAGPTSAQYGGKYLARGGKVEILEGEWLPKRCVVIEFPSVEQAKAWWNSQEYAGPRAIRQSAAKSRFIVVEGL